MVVHGLAFVLGVAVSVGLWLVMTPIFENPTLARTNLHGRSVGTAGGLVIPVAVVGAAAVVAFDAATGWIDLPGELHVGWNAMALLALGLGLLGLVDDLLGDGGRRGFRGHLAALGRGELTTGALKLLGGGVVAALVTAQVHSLPSSNWQLVIDVILVALAANLANLFDRAPGRVTKVAVPLCVALVVAAPSTVGEAAAGRWPPVATVFVIGAAVGLSWPELRERTMLGDTGANVIGGALGLGVVMGLPERSRVVILIVLVGFNLASEKVSFSRVIARTPVLRHIDQWGRARQ